MSESRFIRIKNQNGISIKDTKTGYERYYAIEVLDDLNALSDENEQLKEEIRAYPINEEYAEEIMEQNKKLRIEKIDLQTQNKKLEKEKKHFKNLYNHFKDLYSECCMYKIPEYKSFDYLQCKYFERDYVHKRDVCTKHHADLLNYCLKDKCHEMVKQKDYEVTIEESGDSTSISLKKVR